MSVSGLEESMGENMIAMLRISTITTMKILQKSKIMRAFSSAVFFFHLFSMFLYTLSQAPTFPKSPFIIKTPMSPPVNLSIASKTFKQEVKNLESFKKFSAVFLPSASLSGLPSNFKPAFINCPMIGR